ncbi:nuclear transport factor 2 family protein [Streptomyces sp. SP18CS02]|uniref:nuclear transport factor 2 family protein n=1 Tax=Streptomyces sp. SP18CS02 TaxID=3002531 RepID=UPI002E771F5F|nr:nuclear transport factor 2 family protein [Streptomyces sp. SP18CS02]MEE1757453.1 nuclear transport factor 2 family protein [Streptomyces sp. SP18CS02]
MDDRYAIIETCDRMGWHCDRHEWDKATALFTPKVLVDYTSLLGGTPSAVPATDLVDSWVAVLGGYDASQHLMTNHLVTLEGADAAECTASFQATHRLDNPHGSPLWRIGGTYRFHLIRSGDTWRIDELAMSISWAEGNKNIADIAAERQAAKQTS